MDQAKEPTLPVIPNIQQNKIQLSPFTWTTLKFPRFQDNNQHNQQSSKNQKKVSIRAKIQKQHIQKHQKKLKELKGKELEQKKTDLIRQHDISVMTDKLHINKRNTNKNKKNMTDLLAKTVDLDNRNRQNSTQAKSPSGLKNKNVLQKTIHTDRYFKNKLYKKDYEERVNEEGTKIFWSYNDFSKHQHLLKPGQYFNHLQGSECLSNIFNMHQYLSLHCEQFYQRSFSLPKQSEQFLKQNEHMMIKKFLRSISDQILTYLKNSLPTFNLQKISLGQILQTSIVKQNREDISLLLKLSLYLEILRKQLGFVKYFEASESYMSVDIKPKQMLFRPLIDYVCGANNQSLQKKIVLDYPNLDYRLLILILNYHTLFFQVDSSYSAQNIWIVKSQKEGTEIQVIKNSNQFCLCNPNFYNSLKNQKANNKIYQRYISNPYLLQEPKQFANRKFEIRQFILVMSQYNKPKIYKYKSAYCVFAKQHYTTDQWSKGIHFPSYKQNRQQGEEIMMLEDVFTACKDDLRGKYSQQISDIALNAILNSKDLKYQYGTFELFQFNLLVNSVGKVYIVKVKTNSIKREYASDRIKDQNEKMIKSIFSLINEPAQDKNWIQVGLKLQKQEYSFSEDAALQIKPFYQYSLTQEQSLIEFIRRKQRKTTRFIYVVQNFILKIALKRIVESAMANEDKNGQNDNQNNEMNERDQDSKNDGLIRFIEENQMSVN